MNQIVAQSSSNADNNNLQIEAHGYKLEYKHGYKQMFFIRHRTKKYN